MARLLLSSTIACVFGAWHEGSASVHHKAHDGYVKFVMASTQRSGSTFLGELLNKHPDAIFYRELFMPGEMARLEDALAMEEKVFRNTTRNPLEMWSEGLDLALQQPCKEMKAVGFKWQMNQGLQANSDAVIERLNADNIRLIILARTNLLRQAVSEYAMSSHVGPIHSHETEEQQTSASAVDVPVDFFLSYLRRHEDWHKGLKKLGDNVNNSIFIEYEALSSNKHAYLGEIQAFLDLNPETDKILAEDTLQKIHAGRMEDLVTNWNAKRKHLMKSEFGDRIEAWEQEGMNGVDNIPNVEVSITDRDGPDVLVQTGAHTGTQRRHLWLLENKCSQYKWWGPNTD